MRVVLSDGVKQFGLPAAGRPVLKTELVYDLADRIISPRPKAATPTGSQTPEPAAPSYGVEESESPEAEEPSRARAIFHAADEAKPFDPNDLSFAFDEHAGEEVAENLREPSPSQRLAKPGKKPAISPRQWILLGGMFLLECCILLGFGYLIFLSLR